MNVVLKKQLKIDSNEFWNPFFRNNVGETCFSLKLKLKI